MRQSHVKHVPAAEDGVAALAADLVPKGRSWPPSVCRCYKQQHIHTAGSVCRCATSVLAASLCAGRLADMASQMGVAGASGTLADLSKGVSSMASMLTAEVRPAEYCATCAYLLRGICTGVW